ncbi:MAG: WbqC family protein [Flavobacteriales bacterium]|nr:WbqC family protein [Flavobacteriales bacterium]MCB9447664.1 WbqC family protein [Flavobacteriales bacterium]
MPSDQLVLSTAFFPPAAYFAEIARAREVLIEAHEHYVKQSYRNRCYIYGANGILRLTIPVSHGKGEHTPVSEIRLDNSYDWRKMLWKSIQTAYRTSPFFEYYEDQLLPVFMQDEDFLFPWNQALLTLCLRLLEINTPVHTTESYIPEYPADVRDLRRIHPKGASRGLVLEPLAHTPYPQVFSGTHGYIAGLSILDMLFHVGPRTGDQLLIRD